MLNTAVLVSGGGTNLQALLDASGRGEMPHVKISLVVSNRADAYALERAKKAQIRAEYVANESFEVRLASLLESENVKYILLAGFMRILSKEFLSSWEGRVLNIHPSLIPSFCGSGYYGLRVHAAALERGVKLTGATVHLVNEVPDGGRIVAQRAVEVLDGDTPETLQRRVMEQAEWIIYPQAAEKVAEMLEREENL